MKRILLSLLILPIFSLCVAYPLLAEFIEDDRMPKREMSERMMPDRQMMMQHMPSMKKDIKLVATSDGGIVVLAGNKLLKFDANLKLIAENELKLSEKEVQIRSDKEEMRSQRPAMDDRKTR